MKLSDIDTKKLRYDPKSKNFIKKLTEDIPEFAAYSPHRNKKPVRDRLFGFISVLYDINSPMDYEVLDYYEKKSEVAEMFEFPRKDDGDWEDYVDDMLIGKNKEVNELVAAFIAQFGSPEYIQKIAYTEMLRQQTIKALGKGGDKFTLANIEKLTERLKEVDRVLFRSGKVDEIAEVRKALYAKVEKDRVKIRPEEIVKILEEEGDLPDDFDQYPSIGKEDRRPKLSYYNETKEEREERKTREKKEVEITKHDEEQT